MIDDFSLNQSANSTVMFLPTVLFSQRQLIGPSTVVDGGKAKLVAPNLLDASELRYEVNLDLVGCTEIVLQNVTEFGRTPKLTLHSMASSDIVFGTTTSTEIIFDLGGSPPEHSRESHLNMGGPYFELRCRIAHCGSAHCPVRVGPVAVSGSSTAVLIHTRVRSA
ncbi:MAG: hypothetical protein GY698_24370 [Actinomycetia bacterium]|nr:hypothetical protein [Actinomycetes bacterium]